MRVTIIATGWVLIAVACGTGATVPSNAGGGDGADVSVPNDAQSADTQEPTDTAFPDPGEQDIVDPDTIDPAAWDTAAQDTAAQDTAALDDIAVDTRPEPDDVPEPSDTAAAGAPDADGEDAGSMSVWPDGAPEGQCVNGDDCPAGLCNSDAPGGLCQGCGECPSGYDCNFGTCNQWCDAAEECPLGLKCNASKGVCVAVTCDADAGCQTPYVCREGQCKRPLCTDGACPDPFSCAGAVCIEP